MTVTSDPGAPLWRLISPDGRRAECYVDPLGEGEWMLTFWEGESLKLAEVHPSQDAGFGRAAALRAKWQAEGWR